MSGARPIRYSLVQLAWLEANCTLPFAEYHRRFCEAFRRHDVSAVNLNSLRKRKGWRTGRSGRFAKGQAPANKGAKCEAGKGGNHPNARRTQFRRGERSGIAAELYKPIGTEHLSEEGYLVRKINDDMPLQARWRFVHLIEWERENGPLPEGMVLKCLDSNKANTDPGNWELVPRAIMPRLNGGPRKRYLAYDDAEPELKPTILALAKLDHAARAARKRKAAR